jgi:TetR/AcrR family transcriptional regulator
MAPKQKQKKPPIGRRPKTQRVGLNTRGMILASARKIFAAKGVDGTSVREVALAAKVNTAMIYYHFLDKEDLYRSVLVDSFSALTAIWDNTIFKSPVPVRQKIGKYIEGYIQFHQANEDLRRIMAMEFASSGGDITWLCEKFFADNFSRLTRLFREGIRNHEINKVDPSLAASSLIGVIIHSFIMQPMAEHVHGKRMNLSPKKFGNFVLELFFSGLGRRKRTR